MATGTKAGSEPDQGLRRGLGRGLTGVTTRDRTGLRREVRCGMVKELTIGPGIGAWKGAWKEAGMVLGRKMAQGRRRLVR
jgi:hypothetical protein